MNHESETSWGHIGAFAAIVALVFGCVYGAYQWGWNVGYADSHAEIYGWEVSR